MGIFKKILKFSRKPQKQKKKPILFITCGLSGSGKSHVGKDIAKMFDAGYLQMDKLRKEITSTKGSAAAGFGAGIYSKETTEKVYTRAFEKAGKELSKGNNYMIDATFKEKKYRLMAKETARKHDAGFLILYFTCGEQVIKKRLDSRNENNSISDARWGIYLKQKECMEALGKDEPFISIDTTDSDCCNYTKEGILKAIERPN